MDSTCVDKLTKNEHILVASILQKGGTRAPQAGQYSPVAQ